jgi:hypothetical protein
LGALYIATFLRVFHNDEICVSLFQDKTNITNQNHAILRGFFI